jgi:hypothetical protein
MRLELKTSKNRDRVETVVNKQYHDAGTTWTLEREVNNYDMLRVVENFLIRS